MRQIEALRIIEQEKALWLSPQWRGAFAAYSPLADKTIPARIWERLIDRGDIDIQQSVTRTYHKYLVLTDQGRQRLEAER